MRKWICVLLVAAVLLLTGCDSENYERAVGLYEAGNYAAAARAFEALEDYEDSAHMAMVCRYELAMQKFEKGEWNAAIAAFSQLGNFQDSLQQVTACHYGLANELYESGDLAGAAEAFEVLGVYGDSAQWVEICRYELAWELLNEGKYLEAAQAFGALGSYADAAQKCQDARWLALQDFTSRQESAVTVGEVLVYLASVEDDPDSLSLWAEQTLDLGFYQVTDRCGIVIKRGQSQGSYLLSSDTKTVADGLSGYSACSASGTVELGEVTPGTLLPLTNFAYYGQDVYGTVTQYTQPWLTELVNAQGLLKILLESAPELLGQRGYTLQELGFTGLE